MTSAARELVEDVVDLAGAVAMAGLAWPDPDLAPELRALADRARALRMEEGSARLEHLAEALEQLVGADAASRRERVPQAVERYHRAVAWARLLRVELQLLEAADRAGA